MATELAVEKRTGLLPDEEPVGLVGFVEVLLLELLGRYSFGLSKSRDVFAAQRRRKFPAAVRALPAVYL